MKKTFAMLLALMLIVFAGTCALADYPESNKTITIYSHSGVGSNDLYIRPLQPYLQQELGCNVVIENMTGAAGRLCSNHVWNSDKDGYTVYSMTIPLIAASDVFYQDTNDYRITGFEPMFSFDSTPYAMIVKKGSELDSLEKIIEKAKNDIVINATSGVAGGMHLQSVIMQNAIGATFADIPFDGSTGAMMAVMTGDADTAILPADVPLTNQEEVTVVCVLGDAQLSYYPGVPCTKELGYDFTCLNSRRMLVMPPDTPKEICDAFQAAVERAFAHPDYQKWAENGGYVFEVHTGEEVGAIIQEYYDAVYALKDSIPLE